MTPAASASSAPADAAPPPSAPANAAKNTSGSGARTRPAASASVPAPTSRRRTPAPAGPAPGAAPVVACVARTPTTTTTAPTDRRELPSTWKRLRRLLLRWQAPQPYPAHREHASPGPPRGHFGGTSTPTSMGTPTPTSIPRLGWRTQPRLRPWHQHRPGPPLGERMRARLIHPTAGRLYGSRLRRRSTNSAVRLPHGVLAISAHLRRAALFDGDRRQPRRGQGMNGSSRRRTRTDRQRLQRTDRHTGPLGLSRSVRHPVCSLCCDEPFRTPRRDDPLSTAPVTIRP